MFQEILNRIKAPWSAMRIIRLAMGAFIIAQGVGMQQWFMVAFGVYFVSMALFAFGCCAADGACNLPASKTLPENKTTE